MELAFSALKKAETSDTLVLRFVNLARHEVDARISFGWAPRAVWNADLGERARGRLDLRDGVARMRVRGAEIVTLLLVRQRRTLDECASSSAARAASSASGSCRCSSAPDTRWRA